MRVRFFSLLSAVGLLVLAAAPAQANENRGDGNEGSYLALGDSVPFGFSPLLNPKDADNFVGYPEIVAERLDLRDVNATCPGEATGGFLTLTGIDNVCRPYRFVLKNPLHVRYKTSQMDYALAYLHAHKHSTRLVTLTLGANDAFRFQKDHPECFGPKPPAACGPLTQTLFATMLVNLNTILVNIRASGYTGLLIGVTYYAINYSNPVSAGGAIALNNVMKAAAAAHGALIASGFDAWAPVAALSGGDSCAAGLLIVTSTSPLTCDVHPTPAGRDLLAGAVVKVVADSCSEHNAEECLSRERD